MSKAVKVTVRVVKAVVVDMAQHSLNTPIKLMPAVNAHDKKDPFHKLAKWQWTQCKSVENISYGKHKLQEFLLWCF